VLLVDEHENLEMYVYAPFNLKSEPIATANIKLLILEKYSVVLVNYQCWVADYVTYEAW
jgi:hypothetical protein